MNQPTSPTTTPDLTPTTMKFGNDVVVQEPSTTNTKNYTVLDSDMAKQDYLTKQKFLDQEKQNFITQSMTNAANSQATQGTTDANATANKTADSLNKASDALTGGDNNTGTKTAKTASGNEYTVTGDNYVDQLAAQNADLTAQYQATQTALAKASTTAGLSADQSAQLTALSNQYDQIISQQEHANDFYNGSVTMGTIRSGSSRYATTMAASTVAQAVNEGVAKITKLTNDKNTALDKMRQGFISDNVKAVNDAYKAYSDMSKQITDNIKTIQEHIDKLHQQQLDDQKYALDLQKNQASINKDLNITSPFYQLPGSTKIYESKTGQEITSKEYAQMGGIGEKGGYSDIQMVDPSVNEKHSSAYTEWKDYQATGGKLSFNDYMTMDANRKATRNTTIINDQTKTYDLQVKQAPSQVANLKAQGYGWDQIAQYFNSLGIDPGTPEIDDALHRAFQSQTDYEKWKADSYNTSHGVAQ